ncbi:MAG TPA: polysaccharide deacetylase family protein [Elusimicrobiales bacterium]|nr:polysaccharide deacetylase family protein [Elusimicrobiales bacterium]
MAIAIAALAIIILGLSARWTWWRPKTGGLEVLCYHKIGTPPPGSKLRELWVSPEKFRAQVKFLVDNGYKTLLFSDLLKAYKENAPLPERSVLITFDDGYENNYLTAWPILRELGAKGNIFVVFNTIGKANLWHNPASEAWVNMATLSQLKEMQASGVIEYGSHTMNHPHLGALPLEDAACEMTESKRQLEAALGKEMCAFAYPYGDGAYNTAVRAKALEAGYVFDFSFKQGKTPWPWDRAGGPLDRLFIQGGDNNWDLELQLTRGASRL